jgi:hypothetical protein
MKARSTMLAVLRGARRRISKRWTKGMNLRRGGGCCLWGALNLADTGNAFCRGRLARKVANRLALMVGTSIVAWNDDPIRRKADVLRLLNAAIAGKRRFRSHGDALGERKMP